jgi:hypothetical protein
MQQSEPRVDGEDLEAVVGEPSAGGRGHGASTFSDHSGIADASG